MTEREHAPAPSLDQLFGRVLATHEALAEAQRSWRATEDGLLTDRARAIRECLAGGVKADALAEALQVSRARLYAMTHQGRR